MNRTECFARLFLIISLVFFSISCTQQNDLTENETALLQIENQIDKELLSQLENDPVYKELINLLLKPENELFSYYYPTENPEEISIECVYIKYSDEILLYHTSLTNSYTSYNIKYIEYGLSQFSAKNPMITKAQNSLEETYCKNIRENLIVIEKEAQKYFATLKNTNSFDDRFLEIALIKNSHRLDCINYQAWEYLHSLRKMTVHFPFLIKDLVDQLSWCSYLTLLGLYTEISYCRQRAVSNPTYFFEDAYKERYRETPVYKGQTTAPEDPNGPLYPDVSKDWNDFDFYFTQPNPNVKVNIIVPDPKAIPDWGEEYDIKIEIENNDNSKITHFLIFQYESGKGMVSPAFYNGTETDIRVKVSGGGMPRRFNVVACRNRYMIALTLNMTWYERW